MNTGKLVLGFLAGIAAGAALGVLFAPDKGSAIRKKISRKGEDSLEDLNDKIKALAKEVSNKFEDIKGEANRLAGNGKIKIEEAIAEVSAAAKGRMG